ncbi:MAG: hypothetical protein H6683_05465 [Deltaproteobacteria bacterium]|nr:hypothetical protein [Deltaproteobacteria bacterium]
MTMTWGRWVAAILTLSALALAPAPVEAGSAAGHAVSGKVGVAAKYDSNVDLTSEENAPDLDEGEEEGPEPAQIVELNGLLRFRSPWESPWHLDVEASAIANIHSEETSDTWWVGQGFIDVGYAKGAGGVSATDQVRYFSEPDDTELDNIRNTAQLAYKRTFSPLWQARVAYENQFHTFLQTDEFNYSGNGGVAEIRNTWAPTFATTYSYAYRHFEGDGDDGDGRVGSPKTSDRHTAQLGVEAMLGRRDSLLGSYTFESDAASSDGVYQLGENQGEDENLELDAEFDYVKHLASLLYSHRFGDRVTIAVYNELIFKTFTDSKGSFPGYDEDRTDTLYLGSAWVTVRLIDELYGRARYLYRENQSTIDFEDYQDHIVSGGLEYRF